MKLTIPVNPVPASRPRVPRFGKPYYPKNHTKCKNDVLAALKPANKPILGCIGLSLHFYIKSPKKPKNPYPMGDLDNYCKLIMDCLTDKGYWKDDKQVVRFDEVVKEYSDNPRYEIIITELVQTKQ